MADDRDNDDGEHGFTKKDGLTLVGKYQDALVQARFKIETERDRALLLITGGALTVSFAYVPTLVDKGSVVRIGALILSWIVWVTTLVWGLVAHTISISVYAERIDKLAQGEWGEARQDPWAAKYIESLNLLGIALMVLGFICFGYFAIGNLGRVANGEQETVTAPRHSDSRKKAISVSRKEIAPVEAGPKEVQPLGGPQGAGTPDRQLAPAATGVVPAFPEEKAATR